MSWRTASTWCRRRGRGHGDRANRPWPRSWSSTARPTAPRAHPRPRAARPTPPWGEVRHRDERQRDATSRKEGVVEGDRFAALKAKAAAEGLTDAEAAALGRRYSDGGRAPEPDA